MKTFSQFVESTGWIDNPLPRVEQNTPHRRDAQAYHSAMWAAEKKKVKISDLSSSQRQVNSNHVAKHTGDKGTIRVVKSGKHHMVVDGNHRVAAAIRDGETHIHADVIDADKIKQRMKKIEV